MSRGSVHHNSECAQKASARMAHIWIREDGSDGFGALSASMAVKDSDMLLVLPSAR